MSATREKSIPLSGSTPSHTLKRLKRMRDVVADDASVAEDASEAAPSKTGSTLRKRLRKLSEVTDNKHSTPQAKSATDLSDAKDEKMDLDVESNERTEEETIEKVKELLNKLATKWEKNDEDFNQKITYLRDSTAKLPRFLNDGCLTAKQKKLLVTIGWITTSDLASANADGENPAKGAKANIFGIPNETVWQTILSVVHDHEFVITLNKGAKVSQNEKKSAEEIKALVKQNFPTNKEKYDNIRAIALGFSKSATHGEEQYHSDARHHKNLHKILDQFHLSDFINIKIKVGYGNEATVIIQPIELWKLALREIGAIDPTKKHSGKVTIHSDERFGDLLLILKTVDDRITFSQDLEDRYPPSADSQRLIHIVQETLNHAEKEKQTNLKIQARIYARMLSSGNNYLVSNACDHRKRFAEFLKKLGFSVTTGNVVNATITNADTDFTILANSKKEGKKPGRKPRAGSAPQRNKKPAANASAPRALPRPARAEDLKEKNRDANAVAFVQPLVVPPSAAEIAVSPAHSAAEAAAAAVQRQPQLSKSSAAGLFKPTRWIGKRGGVVRTHSPEPRPR